MPQLLQYILSAIGGLAVISYAYGQWISGKNKYKIDTITLLEKDVETLKSQVIKLSGQITELQGAITEKDKKLGEALAILQGRDPQMQELIKQLNDYILIGKPVMELVIKDVIPTVAKLDKFLNKQQF